MLLRWNVEDPPSALEMRGDDVIHDDRQHNCNRSSIPPEWVDAIW